LVFVRDPQINAKTCLIVDDGSVVLVKEVQGEGVFVTAIASQPVRVQVE
jgi:hypothetical protein